MIQFPDDTTKILFIVPPIIKTIPITFLIILRKQKKEKFFYNKFVPDNKKKFVSTNFL